MKEKTIKWKNGARVKCGANDAYNFFERIRSENDGVLDLDDAVKKSKPRGAPLHNDFDWNKDRAANAHWRSEMRRIVRNLQVVRVDTPTPTRVYESLEVEVVDMKTKEPEMKHVFMRTEDILSSASGRAELLSQAIRDALAFRRRYAALSELAKVIKIIDEVVAGFK